MQNIDLNDRFSKYFITPDYSLFSDSLYFREIEAVLKSNVKILQFRSKNTDPKKLIKFLIEYIKFQVITSAYI